MTSTWIALVALSAVVSLVALVLVLVAPAADIRVLRKPLWIVIVLVPIVGAVAWLVFGRPKRAPVGKRVAKERRRLPKTHQKISADRQVVVDRLTSDIRARSARPSGPSALSPGSPGSLTARARSAQSAAERSASSPATASYTDSYTEE
ncbi:MAG TPA: PLD nuclease N-terminal domain-containing protein, partial [Propionibacteriaceae bacterium]|nr:PLD nuclease N-terminal domain-containing protein [Propionibacteriaceae bacterium]